MESEFSQSSVQKVLRAALGSTDEPSTDAEILTRFIEIRDFTAFEILVLRHGAMVYNVCRSVLKDHHAAEDAVQAVFLILARGAHTVSNRQALAGWLYRVARRLSLRAYDESKRKPFQSLTDHEALVPVSVPEPNDHEAYPTLHREVSRLPDKYQTLIVLCYFEGLSNASAARRLGCPIGTVKSRLERGKKLLAMRMKKYGNTLPTAGIGLAATRLHPLRGEFVDSTIRAAKAFVDGKQAISGASLISQQLAREALHTIRLTKTLWIFGRAAIAGAIVLGAAAVGIKELKKDAETSPIAPIVPAETKPAYVLFPKNEIAARTIADYEKAGAIFGGFVRSSEPNYSHIDPEREYVIDVDHIFQRGASAANKGLPGFLWESALTEDFQNLPNVHTPFGIAIRSKVPLTESNWKRLADLDRLEFLELHCSGESDLKGIVGLKHIKAMNLHAMTPTKAGVRRLSELPRLVQLSLAISNKSAAKELSGLVNLQSLDLYAEESMDACVKELGKLRDLRSLELRSSQMSDACVKEIARLDQLNSLELRSDRLSDANMKELVNLKNLKQLVVLSQEITDSGVKELSKLKGLKSLILTSRELTDDGVKDLANLRDLESLALTSRNLTNRAMKELAVCKRLNSLFLGSSELTDDCTKDLLALDKLKTLRLVAPQLNLKELSSLKNLESLTVLTPMGNESLQEIESLKSLGSLTICLPALTVEGVKKLASLQKLRSLTIYAGEFTDEEIKELRTFKKLTSLALRGLVPNQEELERLRKELPDCNLTVR